MNDTPQDNHTVQPPRRPGRGALIALVVLLGGLIAYWLIFANAWLPENEVAWRSDYEAALAQAAEADRPVLLDFTADWCPPCKQMLRDVYSNKTLAKRIEKHVIPVKVDLSKPNEKQEALARQWGVRGIPTLVILDSEGREVSRRIGYVPGEELVSWLQQAGEREQTALAR